MWRIPALIPINLRDCQFDAVTELDGSVKKAKPRSLVQMATGAGKTYAAITFVYRLLKFARAKRVLFLVNTRNLGEQAEQEFLAYQPADDNRKFTELYSVQRLTSSHVPADAQVCICTIQRMYRPRRIRRGKCLLQKDHLWHFYQQPQRRQEVPLAQIKDVLAALKQAAPRLAPLRVWEAYARLDALPENAAPLTELTALMALIRRACGIDGKLTPFPETVRRNFQTWIMRRHAGVPTGEKFTETQTAFLQLIRDHVMTSFRFERDDLDYAPFDAQGGLGKMHQLFGDQMDGIIEELNGELVA